MAQEDCEDCRRTEAAWEYKHSIELASQQNNSTFDTLVGNRSGTEDNKAQELQVKGKIDIQNDRHVQSKGMQKPTKSNDLPETKCSKEVLSGRGLNDIDQLHFNEWNSAVHECKRNNDKMHHQ